MNNRQKNNNGAIAILFVLILVLAVFVTAACTNGFTDGNPYGWFEKSTSEESTEANGLIVETFSTEKLRLTVQPGGFPPVVDPVPLDPVYPNQYLISGLDEGYYTREITATISGDNSANVRIYWDVVWANEPMTDENDDELEAYNFLQLTSKNVTATTSTVSVVCLQAFENHPIRIVCSALQYEANCIVQYRGVPQALGLDVSDLDYDSDTYVYKIWNDGTDHEIGLLLDNYLHAVGESYVPNIIISASCTGGYNLHVVRCRYDESQSGGITETIVSDQNTVSSFNFIESTNNLDICLTGTSSDGFLNIRYDSTTQKLILKSVCPYISINGMFHTSKEILSFINGVRPVIEINVTDTVTGLSRAFKVSVYDAVDNVSLSSNFMEF